jgi:hypothetical protein
VGAFWCIYLLPLKVVKAAYIFTTSSYSIPQYMGAAILPLRHEKEGVLLLPFLELQNRILEVERVVLI